ncbi:MAG: type II toxin-antitoxin system RelE/ParE family toxin [Phycisphaeraceae bacterium]|nr:type II toxin-antitoxin system RelE/ParE family toxin [Phycisphaeraceae bacterium]
MSGPQRRIRIAWTDTAKNCLKSLPKKVRAGLLHKADELYNCTDPRTVHKPLKGPLAGYYRITYSRYRAVYRVDEEELANGDTLATFTVLFVAAGKRQEYSRDDVYKVAQKIVDLGLIDAPREPPEESSATAEP